MVRSARATLAAHFAPIQLGVATPGGVESIPHAIRALTEQSPDTDVISIDVQNAFNSVHRSAIHDAVSKTFPEFLQHFRNSYSTHPLLRTRLEDTGELVTIPSTNGTLQGSTFSQVFFNLAVHKAYTTTQAQHPNTALFALHDDTYIAGPPLDIIAAAATLTRELQSLGLNTQPEKARAWSRRNTGLYTPTTHGTPSTQGIIVAGAPVGTPTFEKEGAANIAARADHLCAQIDLIPDKQTRLLLIRHCAVPIGTYATRTIPPEHTTSAADALDTSLLRSLQHILDYPPLSPDTTLVAQASLPIRLGGLGITLHRHTSHPAYLASLILSTKTLAKHPAQLNRPAAQDPTPHFTITPPKMQYVQQQLAACKEILNDVRRAEIPPAKITPLPVTVDQLMTATNKLQRCIMNNINELQFHRLRTHYSNTGPPEQSRRNTTRLNALTNEPNPATHILTAIPSNHRLRIQSDVFTSYLRQRLGLPPLTTLPCKCKCGHNMTDAIEADAQHLGICREYGERIHLHNLMIQEIAKMMREANIYPRTEVLVHQLFANAPQNKQQYDFVLEYDRIIGDFTTFHPYSGNYRQKATATISTKHRKYGDLAAANHFTLQVYCMDAFGGMSADLIKLINTCATRVSPKWADTRPLNWTAPNFKAYWTQRIAITFAKRYHTLLENKARYAIRDGQGAFTLDPTPRR